MKSMLSSCNVRLKPLSIRAVRDLTSKDELDLAHMGDEGAKVVLFASMSDTDSTFDFLFALLMDTAVSALCAEALEAHGGSLPTTVHFVFDEFANIGRIPDFERTIAVTRSRNIAVSMIAQSLSQLKETYGDNNAETIVNACDTLLYLGGKANETNEEISKMAGKQTVASETQSDSRGAGWTRTVNRGISERDLIQPAEVARMPREDALVLVNGCMPLMDRKYRLERHPRSRLLKEARETAFTVMSSLFNYFPADSHVQLQVVNAPIPADEVGRKVFFEPGERATAGLAEEYNRILNDKMREGVSNLVRHRYLTYAVGADDVDAAVPKLARIRGDVEQTLARIRCSSRALDGAERLELLQGQLRPGSRFEFSWDKLSPTSGARTKDFVMPSTLDFKPEGRSDCFCSDGRYGAVLAVRSFGSVIEETYLASIIDLPLPLNVTLHVQPIAQSEALALVKRQIDWMDKEIIDEQMSAVKKGYDYQILPPELRFSKEEAEELLDFLRNKSERLFVYTGLVYTWADSLEELDRRVQQVTSVAQGCTIGLEPLHFRQRQALNSVLPLGDNHVTVSRYLTTGQVAMQMPFASQSLDEAGGGYYGQSKESGNLVLCDRKRLASPMGFVCGKPGSGKSFSVKREITNTVLAHPEDEVVIFDPAGEYGNLVGALGGANVELAPGCSAVLNPLDTADVADRADAAKLAYKTDAVLALSSALMAEGREGLPERDRSIIARCVGEAYLECARDGRMPTLGDFHAALLAQPEPEAADIALRYERYVKGAFSFFNGQSNAALDNRITNIDMHGLGQNMRVFGMITALEMVRNRVMVTPPRPNYTWLYIDEVQSLFAHPTVVEYFARLWREGRKFGLICTGISQNTSHMLANAEARDMVLNSEFFLLHKQSTADLDAWAEMLQLSATERGYIGDAVKPGEGLLISAGIRVPITDDFPKGPLYDLWNTKPAEVAEREMRRAAREAEE